MDVLHPRYIEASHIENAKKDPNALSSLCGPQRPRTHRVRSLHTSVVQELVLCWTPKERVALLQFADGARRALLPASWARITLTPLLELHEKAETARFASGTARVPPDSVFVEYANGFTPALELQRAALDAFVSGSPVPLIKAPFTITAHMARYTRYFVLPSVGRLFKSTFGGVARIIAASSQLSTQGVRGFVTIIDGPFRTARKMADSVRARREAAQFTSQQ